MVHSTASHVDLLIIGAGPAGLVAAAWASRCRVSCRIIDNKACRVTAGHADGLQPRTVEILDSFGIADRPVKEGYHNPDKNGRLQRTQRVVSQRPGSSRYQQLAFGQGDIEQIFEDFLRADGGNIRIERNMQPQKLYLDEKKVECRDSYPIRLDIRRNVTRKGSERHENQESNGTGSLDKSSRRNGSTLGDVEKEFNSDAETINAKYLIGCDGAHSWTRNQLGISLEGESTDYVWGVMDIVPLTDFPDIRLSCAIHSASGATLMTVPREKRLVRFYIQLQELGEGQAFDRSNVTLEHLLRAAQAIIAPYRLKHKYCDWWSLYQIGQRVAPKFDVQRRIFLAGDAIHNHSPKAGQGMNVSMQDTHNLCWKICSVLKGQSKPVMLDSYQQERRQVALDLIKVDHEISRFYSVASASQSDFQAFRNKHYDFLSGVAVTYHPSLLSNPWPSLAVTLDVDESIVRTGKRLDSHQILNQADARPTQMADLLRSDGRWRLLIFAGDIRDLEQTRVMNSNASFIRTLVEAFTPPDQKIDSVIEVLTIHSAPRTEVELLDLHEVYHPWDEGLGWDYTKVYVDDVSHHERFGNAYEKYGINRRRGCFVVCRPDSHVACTGNLGALPLVAWEYFGRILIRQR